MEEKRITAYKGFDENLCCRGFQYEVGKEYEQEGEIKCCDNGFHACTNPFDVLKYYSADGKNRFCEVEQYGTISTDNGDTKQSSSRIRIKAEIGCAGLLKAGVKWIKEKTNPVPIIEETKGWGNSQSVDCDRIGSSKYYADIHSRSRDAKIGLSADYAQIHSSGNRSQIGSSGLDVEIHSSGDYAQIGSSGHYDKINSSGTQAQIGSSGLDVEIHSSGDYAQIGSSGLGVEIHSSGTQAQIGSTGDSARISSTGTQAQIGSSGAYAQICSSGTKAQIGSTGDSARISSTGNSARVYSAGEDSVICCTGDHSVVKAKLGSWITLSEWEYSDEKRRKVPVCVKTEYVDGERIKADTWYKLIDGEIKESF